MNSPTAAPREPVELLDPSPVTMSQLVGCYRNLVREGQVIQPGGYTLGRRLGRGRQGQVFLARRFGARGSVQELAVKFFDPSIYRTPEEYGTDMERVAQQVARLHRLQSPAMVARHAYEECQGIGFVLMDVIDGLDLRRFAEGGHIDIVRSRSGADEWSHYARALFGWVQGAISIQPGVVIYIMRRVLSTLERLHREGFLHSDIKPGNIMLDRLGNVRVIDFGRAVMVGERVSFLLGSPMYMAPEIHRREPGLPQSDIFSLGLVAIELLRGRRLSQSHSVSEDELLALKLTLADRLDELLPPQVVENKELVSVLRRCLAPDAADRYAGAREADTEHGGFWLIDKQLVQAGLDSDYPRDLEHYLNRLAGSRGDRIAPVEPTDEWDS
jgi:serine/threonine protein kinase